MTDDSKALDEVVVIGYGTVNKRGFNRIGSFCQFQGPGSCSGIQCHQKPLHGKLAGVSITTTEGAPDADVKIRVRGGGSLSQDNSPLIYCRRISRYQVSLTLLQSEIQSVLMY